VVVNWQPATAANVRAGQWLRWRTFASRVVSVDKTAGWVLIRMADHRSVKVRPARRVEISTDPGPSFVAARSVLTDDDLAWARSRAQGRIMSRPRLLDLFCGAGGASMGYHRAGFDVTGVDNRPQPRYPFRFVQADALRPPVDLGAFDVIHASPPCQRWTGAGTNRKLGEAHPDLLTPAMAMLTTTGKPYVIENVPTAPLPGWVLCGSTFGLPIVRHRRFLTWPDIGLVPMACSARRFGRASDHGRRFAPYARGPWQGRWRAEVLPVVWPWMDLSEAGEAIPPAYTEYIGRQFLEHSFV
jgi:DNA (cytosine-5)-methyltransferase 1